MRILDCFLYCDEIELLELRINLLKDYVDGFIICEADKTFGGQSKNFTCKTALELLNLNSSKIQIIQINLPELNPFWRNQTTVRETLQRDAIANYIKDNDVAFIGDCDEIIDPQHIKYYASVAYQNQNKILRVPMVYLMGRANNRVYNTNNTPLIWSAPFFCTANHLKRSTISEIRLNYFDQKNDKFENIYLTENGQVFDSGWHFSQMGNTTEQLKKFHCFYNYSNISISEMSNRNNILNPLGIKNIDLKPYFKENLPALVFNLPRVKELLLPVHSWQDIDGFFEYPNFYRMCFDQLDENSTLVEVGSWMGRSTSYMASLIKTSGKNMKFFSIDTWKGSTAEDGHIRWIKQLEQRGSSLFQEYLDNLTSCGLIDYVTPIRSPSVEASQRFEDNSIDFIHIDASHEYKDVLEDLKSWYSKIKPGGLITGDDYGWPGVYSAVNEFFTGKVVLNFEHDNRHGNVWYHVKI